MQTDILYLLHDYMKRGKNSTSALIDAYACVIHESAENSSFETSNSNELDEKMRKVGERLPDLDVESIIFELVLRGLRRI